MTPLAVPALLADFTVTPDAHGGPGGAALQTLIDWTAYLSLGLCTLCVVMGGAGLALAHFGDNYRASRFGKFSLLGGFAGAGIIALATALIHFATRVGGQG